MIRRFHGWLKQAVKLVGSRRQPPAERPRWRVEAGLIVRDLEPEDMAHEPRRRRHPSWLRRRTFRHEDVTAAGLR